MALAQRAGDEIVVNQALSVRASIYRDQGRLDLCAAMLAELEPRWNRTLPAGHIAFATLALHYSRLALARGDIPAALIASDQALILAVASESNQDALPMLLIPRAELELRAGQLQEAMVDVTKAITLEQEVAGPGARSSWIGRAHLSSARILLAQGQTDPARAAFASALEQLQPTLGADHPETREAARAAVQP